MTTDRMQARRDAFLMITDERPPAEPKRWLVVWTDIDVHGVKWTDWANYAEASRAVSCAADMSGKVHDLDNQ